MARRARQLLAGQLYHLLLRGNNRQAVFIDDEDRDAFRQILGDACRQQGVALHAWLLLPERVQLLLTPGHVDALGYVVQTLGRQYVRLFNRRHLRTGTLWEGRFRSSLIEAPRFGLLCQRHLECLPRQLGLVPRPEDYPWSSCRHHLGLAHGGNHQPQMAWWALGNTPFDREREWRTLLDEPGTDADLAALETALPHHSLTHALQYGHPVATAEWLQQLERYHGAPLQVLPVGRPRRSAA